MYKINSVAKKIIYLLSLTTAHFSSCWTVKVINLTDEKITADIHSTQLYPGLNNGLPVKRECEFIGKQVDPHSSNDFDYKEVNPICVAPCTKSVTITSPIELNVNNTLTSCSNVIVIVRKDESNQWKIEYHDWTAGILKMLEERTKMPVRVRDLYDTFGDSPIQALSVFREPVQAGVNELITAITKNELKKLKYDELYHTGFIIKCQDRLIRLERNQTVAGDIYIIKPEEKKQLELRDIQLPRMIRYNEFISNAMNNDANFWKYHPVNNNCQSFVLQCLTRNNIEISQDLYEFIYQDAEKILENSPGLKKFAVSVTSVANRIDNLREGNKVTVQNGTPYTLRVLMRYAGESVPLKSCLRDDFLLESGSERTVSHGLCLLEGIKVGASSKGIDTLKGISPEQLPQAADIFAESSFVGRGKASVNFLIRFGDGKKLIIENIEHQHLSQAELQKMVARAA